MKENHNEKQTNKHPHIDLKRLLGYMFIFVAAPILAYTTGRWIDSVLSLPKFPPFPINLIAGLGVLLSGLIVGIKATRQLYTQGQGLPWGETDGKSQTKALVTSGLYTHTRNPMVLGYSLLPCGMGVMFQSLGTALPIAVATFVIAASWAKLLEEPHLRKRFGDAYQEYKQQTPFLIPRVKRSNILPVTSIAISLLGLCLLSLLTFSISIAGAYPFQKVLVGSLFVMICSIGATVGISPSRCSRLLHFENKSRRRNPIAIREKNFAGTKTSIRGHHPTCSDFQSHVFQFGGRTYCTGCTALVGGAIVASAGTTLYFLAELGIGNAGQTLFWIGFVGVSLGLLQYAWFAGKALVHFLLDVFFVTGTFFLLVGVDSVNGTIALELYLLALIPYWIMTRITLSRWEHAKKCANCKSETCKAAERLS